MDLKEKATIIHFHRHRIGAFKDGTVKALGWKGDESQIKRFEVMAGLANLDGASVMDLGCGYGDLKGFLDGRFKGFAYIGIDQMPEFIAEAKKRYGNVTHTFFYQTDFVAAELPQVDYVFASGALGYRTDKPCFYREMIAKMYASANRALAFNMLDASTFPDHPLLVGHDVEKTEAFCKELSPKVKVVRGYFEDDFTVFMYRE